MAGRLPDADDYGDDGGGGGGIFAEINITPLTDVFLVMVIIFMVSALAVQAEADQKQQQVDQVQQKLDAEKRSGLKITLPQGAAQEIDPNKASIVLLIPINGDIVVDGKTVADPELDNLFRHAFARDKNTQVVIQADKGVQHGRVVNAMERARSAGLVRLMISTSGAGGP
ncbi:MAG TPA: biopolymer transporter ExbD [Kofleriaceae bacterium]|nr:biopolymer transporter ExbD [Kofleriaceae bacterium]